jgi:hypothetical protein
MTRELPDCLPYEKWKIATGKAKLPIRRIIESIYRENVGSSTYLFWNESRYSEADGKPISTYLSQVGKEITEDGKELDDKSDYELNAKTLARIKPFINAATQAYDYNRNCPITARELFTIPEKVAEMSFELEVKTQPKAKQ